MAAAANPDPASPGTLGDVLYNGHSTAPVAEAEWAALVQSIAAGDQAALHALYERAHRPVFTLMVRIMANREAAEELTLDVFHDVWRRASAYDAAGGSVVGWVMNQARSRAIDRLRFMQRKKRVDPYPVDPDSTASAAGPDDAMVLAQHGQLLRTALAALSQSERQAIESAFFAELTYAQVAAQLNEPLGTIKSRIRAALKKLRATLPRELSP